MATELETNVQAGVEAGEDGAVVQALKAQRQAKREKATKSTQTAKTEPQGQPEQSAKTAEPEKPTASNDEPTEAPPEATTETAEVTPEKPKELRYKIAADGKEEEVSLDELRSGYLRQRDYTHKTMEHAKEREAFSKERTQRQQVIDSTLNELATLSQHMVQRLVDDDHRTDWQSLKDTDPEQYAVKLAERSERRELLRQVLAKAGQLDEQRRKETEAQEAAELAKLRQEHEHKLALTIPDFADPEKAKTLKADLTAHLVERGFTNDELDSIVDYRFRALARDAMLYQRIQEAKKKAETEKKVEGKTVVSQVSPQSKNTNSKIDSLRAKVKQSGGKPMDVAKLLSERRKARLKNGSAHQ